jgi:hypothetical protein
MSTNKSLRCEPCELISCDVRVGRHRWDNWKWRLIFSGTKTQFACDIFPLQFPLLLSFELRRNPESNREL